MASANDTLTAGYSRKYNIVAYYYIIILWPAVWRSSYLCIGSVSSYNLAGNTIEAVTGNQCISISHQRNSCGQPVCGLMQPAINTSLAFFCGVIGNIGVAASNRPSLYVPACGISSAVEGGQQSQLEANQSYRQAPQLQWQWRNIINVCIAANCVAVAFSSWQHAAGYWQHHRMLASSQPAMASSNISVLSISVVSAKRSYQQYRWRRSYQYVGGSMAAK